MGTRTGIEGRRNAATDHPHAYGDKDTYGYNPDRHIGSSPRVWGQVAVEEGTVVTAGIIPTRMGTSLCSYR